MAVSGGAGREYIRNSGWLDGDVTLGAGHDRFDNRGGQISGQAYGGKGNDAYVIDHWISLVEKAGGGTDTVKSSVSYALGAHFENLTLFGSASASATGNAQDNRITGNGSSNVLTGGAGADRFIFLTGAGHDRIADFENGRDRIDLGKVDAMASFADIKAHMKASHGDVVINFAGTEAGLRITLTDTDIRDIGASDFLF